ncbi:hypothetical protein TKK_0015914 [Trichogramma kaykai]|uniref:Uncharacterized protein n=1 Tax=Trichogramma kaykai TaxID=54128 RepID=A0ABD2W9E3_9HYME
MDTKKKFSWAKNGFAKCPFPAAKFKTSKFLPIKEEHAALCLQCNQILHNTVDDRLQSHRKRCIWVPKKVDKATNTSLKAEPAKIKQRSTSVPRRVSIASSIAQKEHFDNHKLKKEATYSERIEQLRQLVAQLNDEMKDLLVVEQSVAQLTPCRNINIQPIIEATNINQTPISLVCRKSNNTINDINNNQVSVSSATKEMKIPTLQERKSRLEAAQSCSLASSVIEDLEISKLNRNRDSSLRRLVMEFEDSKAVNEQSKEKNDNLVKKQYDNYEKVVALLEKRKSAKCNLARRGRLVKEATSEQ